MCDRLQVGTESTSGREQADNMQKEKVFVLNEQDKKGDSITEDKTNALLKDPKRQPVICLNDQGGAYMNVTENKTNALRAQEHGHQPCVYTLKIRGGEKVEEREL